MRLENNFYNIINHNNVALEADLKCSCGSETFRITHTGVTKKGLFSSNYIKKKDKQIIIKAKCTLCEKEYLIYDSTKDGSNPKGIPLTEYIPFSVKDNEIFKINLKYNFYPENFMTDKFEMIFIDAKIDNKEIRIYEE